MVVIANHRAHPPSALADLQEAQHLAALHTFLMIELFSFHKTGWHRFIGPKRVAVLIVLVCCVGLAWYLRKHGWLDPTAIEQLIGRYPLTAPVVFALIYGIAMLSALPTLPVNLAAGLFWGPLLGGIYSTSGATIGAVIAFGLARSILGQPLARHFNNRFIAEIQREFEAKGWLFLAFVRLNPIFPTGPLNYLLGLTAVDIFTYVWTTFVFNLPPSIAVAWIGYSLGSFVVQGEIADTTHAILAVSAAITSLAALAYVAGLFYKLRGGQRPNA
jgi:uncharacterized membrane protein YdjX (TVP38/TMEM64 family)